MLGGTLDWTATGPGEIDLAGMRLAALAARLRPDIIHLNSPALGANVRFPAPVVMGCHSCVKTWWMALQGDAPLPDDLAWRAEMTHRGYRAADVLIAPTQAFSQITLRAYGLPTSPCTIHNGCEPSARQTASSAPSEPFVFTAGRLWDAGKDVATLDRAAKRLAASTPPISVVAAGAVEGPNGERLSLDGVRTLGRLDEHDLWRRYSARPIFVSPAVYEPFGLAVLEAAQAGCALILSDIATFRELWDGAAVFFPAGDDEALATAIHDLANDTNRRHSLGEAAAARASRYTIGAMANNVLALYGDVLERRCAGDAA